MYHTKARRVLIVIPGILFINSTLIGQSHDQHNPKSPSRQKQPNQQVSTRSATLSAMLVDAEKKARNKAATVQVTVKGTALVDPAKANGHLHYQVDEGDEGPLV